MSQESDLREIDMIANTTPNFSLADRVVLVTGASRGIGRACALACAGAGADVIVGVRNPSDGSALTKEIEAQGRRALAVPIDLTDLPGVRASITKAHKRSEEHTSELQSR